MNLLLHSITGNLDLLLYLFYGTCAILISTGIIMGQVEVYQAKRRLNK